MPIRLRTALLSVLGPAALVVAPLLASAPAHAGVNDFEYASWDSEYRLGLDDEGRATAHVTETLVARFPDFDQNRGIIRGLVEEYRGAPLDVDVLAIRDENGDDVSYEEDSDDGVLYLSIDDDTYKHGLNTYVIEYTMRDFIHRPDDVDIDEFYWDLLPLDSTQPIEEFTGTIAFDEALATHLTGDRSCYQGRYGSTDTCTLTPDADADGAAFRVTASDLPARAGVTVSFALDAGTVVPPPALQADPRTDMLPTALGLGTLALVPAVGFTARGLSRRRAAAQGRGIVVAQYEVPDDLPPALAAQIVRKPRRGTPAEIVHLAVRGALRIQDGNRKPVLTLVDPTIPVHPLDRKTVSAIFPALSPGTSVDLGTPDDGLVKRLHAVTAAARTAAEERGLIERKRSLPAVIMGVLGLLGGLAVLGFSLPGALVGRQSSQAVFALGIVAMAVLIVLALILFTRQRLLTAEGARAAEHLQGAEEFIRVAEADRLRMLQSYTGAERRADGAVDVVHLYEKLLPYAMVFGLEKEWASVLEVRYQEQSTTPSWYTGYVIGSFTHSLTRMGGTLTPTATPSTTSSSSSSGSFGGGFSGGGGGGGFSGGR